MIYAKPAQTFDATLQGAPTGLVGTLGVRIIDQPAGTQVTARTTAGISEQPAGSGIYSTVLTAPDTAGTYLVVWDTGGVAPVYASEELSVTSTLPVPAAEPQIRPTVAEVAILLRTRTVGESSGGLGGDTSPADVTTFTSETRPTAAEVEAVIDQAIEAITAQLPPNIPALYYAQTRHNVALYAAILIEGSFFRESLDEGSVDLYRDLLRTGMPTLATAIDEENAETTGEGFASVVVRSATVAAAYPYLPLVP